MNVDKGGKDMTAFVIQHGLLRYKQMPFGLNIAPVTFQRVINFILSTVKGYYALVY